MLATQVTKVGYEVKTEEASERCDAKGRDTKAYLCVVAVDLRENANEAII